MMKKYKCPYCARTKELSGNWIYVFCPACLEPMVEVPMDKKEKIIIMEDKQKWQR